jgi:hypothetical protein
MTKWHNHQPRLHRKRLSAYTVTNARNKRGRRKASDVVSCSSPSSHSVLNPATYDRATWHSRSDKAPFAHLGQVQVEINDVTHVLAPGYKAVVEDCQDLPHPEDHR